MKPIVKALLWAASAAFAVWLYSAPYLTVRAMEDAIDRGDADAFSARVDYPALRESLKAELAPRMAARIAEADRSGGLIERAGARFAGAFGAPMLDGAVDALVSPDVVAIAIAGRDLARDPRFAAVAGLAYRRAVDPAALDLDAVRRDVRMTMEYESPGRFAVHLQRVAATDPATGARTTLLFERRRLLWWKLAAIRLP